MATRRSCGAITCRRITAATSRPCNVVATVHVQVGWPGDPLGETAWLASLRAREGLPSVGAGQAELQEAGVAEVLAGHARED